MTAGGDFGADGLGVSVVERNPSPRRRTPREVPQLVPRDHVIGDEIARSTVIDFSDNGL